MDGDEAQANAVDSLGREVEMARVQKQFEEFHETIKLKRFGENEILREKRDIIRGKLKERLPGVFENHGEECPSFYFRDQGSYEMGTGTKPLNADYDIDQGLYFEVGTAAYPDPVVLKQRVHEAIKGHTKEVRIRRPCVTVFYEREDEPLYHVDIAVYSDAAENRDGKAWLCQNSGRQYRRDDSQFVIRTDYAAAISSINPCHRARKTRRLSDNDTCSPERRRMRKY